MEYKKKDVFALPKRIGKGGLRLDEDEREHAVFLSEVTSLAGKQHHHIETVHLHEQSCDIELVPKRFRTSLLKIMDKYTSGFSKLEGDAWVPAESPKGL